MHYRGGRNRLDRIETGPELALDSSEREPRGYNKDIRTCVIVGVYGNPILPWVRTEADHRDSTTERVIDLAGFGPFQGRYHQAGSVEEASVLELGLHRSPIHDIEVRVSAER